MGKKHLCFFQTAETGKQTPNSGVKGSGANHYPRGSAPAFVRCWTNVEDVEPTLYKCHTNVFVCWDITTYVQQRVSFRYICFWVFSLYSINPLTAKLFNLNFHPLEVVSRWRDPQLQVSENYSDLTKWRSTLFKSFWLMSQLMTVS